MSLAEQSRQLVVWGRENAERLGTRPFSLDRQRWTDFANRTDGYVTNEPDLPRVAWHWFFEVHPHAIERAWLTAPEAYPDIPNPLVPTLHAFLSPKEREPNLARLHDLQGHFAVYRPCFIDTDHIMVMAMECGVGGDISRFSIDMSFLNEDGEEQNEHVEGYALPYQDSLLFQGRLVEAAAPFIFVLSGFPVDPKTGKISKGDGTLLVAAGGTLSSAYPVTIRRTAKKIEPRTYDSEAFVRAVPAHKGILNVMGRGMVDWR